MCMVLYISGELCFSYSDYSILLFLNTLLTIVSFILDCYADYCGILMETSIICTLIIFLLFVVARLQNSIVNIGSWVNSKNTLFGGTLQ